MNIERRHLITAHECIRDAADALQGVLVSLHLHNRSQADDYYEDAVALLEGAARELGGRISWDGVDWKDRAEAADQALEATIEQWDASLSEWSHP